MKLILEATVAGKSQVLADGLVRIHVIEIIPRQCAAVPDSGQCRNTATGRGLFAGLCESHQPPPSNDPRDRHRNWPNGGQTVERNIGRLSMTAELWTWVRDWIRAAVELGLVEIDVHEIEYRPDHAKRPETMRGRLLDAVENRARTVGDAPGDTQGPKQGQQPQDEADEARKHKISRLFKEVQSHRKGK
jgi:hypothetical protein